MKEIARGANARSGGLGGFFITIRDTEYPYKYVRSFANRGREPVGVRGSAWATSSVARSSVASSLDRHSRATERAAFGSRRRNRFGSVLFLIFLRRIASVRDGRSARSDRSKKGLRRESSINSSFWGLSSRPIDSIRSDPIRPDRSRPRFAPSVVEPRRAWVSPRRGE